MDYGSIAGPRTVGYALAQETYDYMMRLLSLGILEGALGSMRPTPEVRRVLEALHTVAAGGEVRIEVVHRGNPDIVRELEGRMERGMADANTINQKSGYYVTVA